MQAVDQQLEVGDIHLSEIEFWALPEVTREGAFKTLRDGQPVSFHYEVGFETLPAGPGYWSLVRYDDVRRVSRDAETFVSGKGTNIPDLPEFLNEFYGSMINMDDPRHAHLRRIVSKAFTPRRVQDLNDYVGAKAAEIVDRVSRLDGECDFVQQIAAPLPLEIICEMMGIDRSHWHRVLELTNVILSGGDPEFVTSMEDLMSATLEMAAIATETARTKMADPGDDLVSAMVTANVDGEHLTAEEFGSFFILLAAAGNETTRTAISHGMKAFTDNPEQRALLLADPDGRMPGAVEEIVRWASPVIHFRRTATRDVVIGDREVKEGDKVVIWYNSANRDDRHFDRPFEFDITRAPNDHLGFGGGGPHFCLGANLARREIGAMFRELFTRLPDIHVTEEPDMLQSGFIHGVKRMPCAWSAGG